MEKTFQPKRKMTPERAQRLLVEKGKKVSLEKADKILAHLDFLAELVIAQHFTKKTNSKV